MIVTNAMKTINSHFNEINLPFSINIRANNSAKESDQPSSKADKNSGQLLTFLSLRYKQQTQWIHRHRHQTVLSMINLTLPVCLIPSYSLITLKMHFSPVTFVHSFLSQFIHRDVIHHKKP